MVISSIDIGTNTVLLLIAETKFKNNKIIPLLNEYRIPRIGKNVNSSGIISEESVFRLTDILLEYKQLSESYGSTHIIAAATAAFRKAINSKAIIEKVYSQTGIRIEIIDGMNEALYAYYGVIDGLFKQDEILVIDIGGGSTEIVLGKDDKILYRKSFDIGVVTLKEHYEIEDTRNHIQEVLAELKDFIINPVSSFAIAGTPTTLAAIDLEIGDFYEERIEGYKLSRHFINNFINDYLNRKQNYIQRFNKILYGREDLIIPGSMILSSIMEYLDLNDITVSTRGIRHGLIINYLKTHG